jgi:hypothetical protein
LSSYTRYYEYAGVIHIHSRYSDGSGSVKKIIKAAQKAGLDYIIITDHNTIKGLEDGAEGWYDDLLVLVGEEISRERESHYLALGISDAIKPEKGHHGISSYTELVKSQDGIGFVAHPDGLENDTFNLHLSPLDAWEDENYTGLEIWSYMRDWSENAKLFNILHNYLRPDQAIDGPTEDLLKKWDEICQIRRVVGIGGADVHAIHLPFFRFIKFLSYYRVFRGIRTHFLTQSPLSKDLNNSKETAYNALRYGHCFFAHDSLADSTGFFFRAIIPECRELIMGDELKLLSAVELDIYSPIPAYIKLLHNGEKVAEAKESTKLVWKAEEAGVYRVEALYDNRPWVFTNPIYLR